MSVANYKISIKRAPPNIIPLTQVYPPPGPHPPMNQYAQTEDEALAICDEMIRNGFCVEVEGPGLHWDREEVKRRVKK